ncbi:MAG: sigma-70 family RNA polymerase sigma factor [Oscillospiraceae bacterium]|nr:sigma-70 family RNA polymerase sigma factor [Oscillospiraceae bacterium]MCI6358793.1 sigma-70 family RNA polymerase sigma factor [Clostridiales bacterium]MDD6936063.1 sigma-70 family RNA polymerase sigma factor [Clostridiales bacterium]MDY2962194.1 sigma-70 family RNA polymerase sigma factor [Oscillospiraceae bacterium]MDY5594922.1 sigma-70 family RNA polymerase sigma factor [Oscillospiraceae bacterium]
MTDYSILSDQELQACAAAGDPDAEEALAERYVRSVRICARPLFLAGGDSEDLIQEGMLGLLSAIRQYDPSANVPFKTYAELCINRRLYSAVKSAARLKHLPLNNGVPLDSILSEESQPQATSYPEANRRITEEQVLARESEKELHSAFSQYLSGFEAKVLQLYLSGLSYAEMAAQTHKSEKSIDNAVQRIRRKLARLPNFSDFSVS